jgi:prepilin peptidase CpaA
MLSNLTITVFAGVLLIAALSDWRSRRIPNPLILSALVLALGLRLVIGAGIFVQGVLGLGLAFAIMLPLFAVRGVGGGDAKLMMVVGAFLGPKGLIVALLSTALVGGVMSLIAALRGGMLLPVLFNTGGLFRWMVTFGRRGERTTLLSPGVLSVPYGVAIAVGSIFALYYGGGL